MTSRFSIVIPLYNKEDYIEKTLESVLDQTYTELEVIIVDDGSTDNSVSIVNGFSDDRIKLISQNNSGVSIARNTGVANSQNPYVAFLDADDTWSINYLEEISKLITTYPESSCYVSALQKNNNNRIISYRSNHGDEGCLDYLEFISSGGIISSSSVVIKKSIFTKTSTFRAGYPLGEDVDMWIRVGMETSISFTNRVSVSFEVHPENTSINAFKEIPLKLPLTETIKEVDSRIFYSFIRKQIISYYLKISIINSRSRGCEFYKINKDVIPVVLTMLPRPILQLYWNFLKAEIKIKQYFKIKCQPIII